jgi:LmbE family N-acetylglucosaminyl deacetylase
LNVGQVAEPKVVLVMMSHPDDAEFSSGGTLALWADQRCTIHYVLATSGDKGSKDLDMTAERLAAIREREQQEAARRIGVSTVTFLRHPDGEFQPIMANRESFARIIRQVRPDVLMTHDPWRRYQLHPDHRAVGTCVLDAMVAARDHLYLPRLFFDEGLSPHAVREILLFSTDEPNVWADISASFDRKLHALRAHESQVTRIPDLEGRMRERARLAGEPHGVELAETFHLVQQ